MKQITGTWQNLNGSPVAGGRIFLKLSQDATVFGINQVSTALVSITLDSTGSIPAGTQVWANDELQPSGTTYAVSVLDAGGGLVWGSENISISGTTPININLLVPTQGVGTVAPGVVLLNPANTQSISGFNLALVGLTIGGGSTLSTTNQTGTGSLVMSGSPTITSPTLLTPSIGVATGTSLSLGGGTALTTTNQTGTGSLVLQTSPSLTTPSIGVATGTSLALGGGTALTTTNQTGTGSLVLQTSPTLTTPNIGAASGTSLAIAGTGVGSSTSVAAVFSGNSSSTGGIQVFSGQLGVNAAERFRVEPSSGVVLANNLHIQALTAGIFSGTDAASIDQTGTAKVTRLQAVRIADMFAGADWVAKVNAADADFSGAPGEVWVSQLAGTSASTALALTGGRRVRFIQGGIYTTSVGLNLGAGQCLVGNGEQSTSTGNEVVIKAANGSNLAFVVGTSSGNVCLENITIDGNKANNPSGGVGLKITDGGRFEASNVTVQNSPSHGIWVFSTGTGDLACCGKYHRMFVFQNNGDGFYSQNTADVFVGGETEVENNGIDAVVNCAASTCTFVSGTVWSNNTASLAGTKAIVNGSTLTVSSVTSTTMVFTTTVGTLTGVHLYSGAGYELSDSPTWRIRNGDIGGNAAGGILAYGTDAGLQSNELMISNNEFGNNLGPDISIFGFGSSVYAATAHNIIGNTFIGCGGVGTCQANTFPMIALSDDKNSNVAGNVFDNHATIKKSYGIQITESSANRNVNTRVGPNSYGNNLGTANTNCLTSSSGGMCIADSTRSTTILCPSQGQAAGIVGNSTDLTLFSCTIPAWTLGLTRSIKVHAGWNHTAGAAAVTYKAFYGANSLTIASNAAAGEAAGIFYIQASAATNAQTIIVDPIYAGTTIIGGINRAGIATDSTTAQTLKVTFNVAATDTVTPTEFWAELIY